MTTIPEHGPPGGLLRAARRLVEAVVVLLFAGILAVFAMAVVSRYLLGRPLIWSDEVLVLAMTWCTFLTGALVVGEREQVVFDLVYERCPPAVRRAVLVAGSVLLVAILGAALPAIVDYTRFLWRERTNVLELRLDVAYACFALFVAALILRRIVLIVRLLGPDWRAAVVSVEAGGADAAGDRTGGEP